MASCNCDPGEAIGFWMFGVLAVMRPDSFVLIALLLNDYGRFLQALEDFSVEVFVAACCEIPASRHAIGAVLPRHQHFDLTNTTTICSASTSSSVYPGSFPS